MKLLMRKTGFSLIPTTEHGEDKLNELPSSEYMVEIKKSRNPGHHRKAFSLLNKLFENQDRYDVFEDFFVEIKLLCGWYEEHITMKGKTIYVPKSIAFENMDQTEFDEFYNRLITVAMEKFGFEEAHTYA